MNETCREKKQMTETYSCISIPKAANVKRFNELILLKCNERNNVLALLIV